MHPGIKNRLQLFRDNTELQKNDNRQLDERETERNGKERWGWERGNSSRHPSTLEGANNDEHKPLSRTITIRAINLSLSPITRIMRAARVSASITFEIPHGLALIPSCCRAHARYIFFFFVPILSRVFHLDDMCIIGVISLVTDFFQQSGTDFSLAEI